MIAKLLISPKLEKRGEEINKILSENNLTYSHPDLLYYSYDSKLGIAEAKKIKQHFALKPYSAKGRAVVLEDSGELTIEAQNALLKTLEELPKDALFILGANSDAKLLPTVLSRCQVEKLHFTVDSEQEHYKEDIEKLLELSIPERFEYIEKLKDREEFFHSLIEYFHKKLPENPAFLKELLQTEQWAKQNVNIRAILEYLMLVMPQKL